MLFLAARPGPPSPGPIEQTPQVYLLPICSTVRDIAVPLDVIRRVSSEPPMFPSRRFYLQATIIRSPSGLFSLSLPHVPPSLLTLDLIVAEVAGRCQLSLVSNFFLTSFARV
jgi:hypothetical protein